MSRRSGFTLVELMVAIVVTSIVALLAWSTVSAGLDTSDRLERHRVTVEARMIVRALLLDALRHLPEGGGAAMNDALFLVDDAVTADGLPVDALHFLSRGLTPPLGSSGMWTVTIEPAAEGLRLAASPANASDIAPIETTLPGVRGLQVRVLARTADSVWLERWDVLGRVPAAVALEFLSERGEPVTPPLVVHAGLEAMR